MQYVNPFLPLVGVIVGAALTFFATAYKDSVQWKRSESARVNELRRKAYADYAGAIKLETTTCRRMASFLGFHNTGGKISIDKGLEQMSKHQDERSAYFEALLLVGSAATVAAARRWHNAVWELRKFVRDEPNGREVSFPELYRRTGAARDNFYVEARRDLQVVGEVSAFSPDDLSPPELVNTELV